jgi:hypothetical protein
VPKYITYNGENLNVYSCASYYVECCVNHGKEIVISKATCFFYRNKKTEEIFLITNWHVVTGRNPQTGQMIDSNGAIPSYLKLNLLQTIGTEHIKQVNYIIDLYNNDIPLWVELEKKNDQVIDVVALPCKLSEDYMVNCINDLEELYNEDTKINIAEDVFVIGFPFGITVGNVFPIWKRASVASEIAIDIDDLPKFYIDTATRAGMSGSPVIKYAKRPFSISSGNPTMGKVSQHFTKFVGVYSGRIGDDKDLGIEAQLGVVWKAKIIDELLTLKSPLEKEAQLLD